MQAIEAARHGPVPWWQRKVERLRSCWSIPGADAALADRLFRLQARNTSVNWWISDSVTFLSALLVVMGEPAPSAPWLLWLGAVGVCSLMLIRVRGSSVGQRREHRGVAQRTLIMAGLTLGLVYSAGLA